MSDRPSFAEILYPPSPASPNPTPAPQPAAFAERLYPPTAPGAPASVPDNPPVPQSAAAVERTAAAAPSAPAESDKPEQPKPAPLIERAAIALYGDAVEMEGAVNFSEPLPASVKDLPDFEIPPELRDPSVNEEAAAAEMAQFKAGLVAAGIGARALQRCNVCCQ